MTAPGRRGLLVRVDGTTEVVDLDEIGADHELDVMRQAIGCSCVELVMLAPDLHMWVDEEGRLVHAPVNVFASALAAGCGFDAQFYVGHALFTGGLTAATGRIRGLSARVIRQLRDWLPAAPVSP